MLNALDPELMTPAERLDEIAKMLTAGILWVRARLRAPRGSTAEQVRVDFSPRRSGLSLWSTETESMTDSIAAQVAALPKKPMPELKQMWRELFDKEPPALAATT